MTERSGRYLRRSAKALTLGPSAMCWDGNCLRLDINELAAPIPKRVRGTVSLYPRMTVPHAVFLDAAHRHRWQPIAPSARVEIAFEQPSLRWSGEGYLDSNAGDAPLESSFSRWDWSRVALGQDTAVLYDVSARDRGDMELAVRFDRTGRATSFQPPPRAPLPRTGWRVARGTRADAGHCPRIVETLEDGPFYARSVIETRLGGEAATGVHESLSLDRFGRLWVQSLLPFRMPRSFGGGAA